RKPRFSSNNQRRTAGLDAAPKNDKPACVRLSVPAPPAGSISTTSPADENARMWWCENAAPHSLPKPVAPLGVACPVTLLTIMSVLLVSLAAPPLFDSPH